MNKKYYIAVEYYDAEGKRVSRRFVNERAFGCMYSFVSDINKAKFFSDLKSAKKYMKNFIAPTKSKVFYEIMYDMV